MWPSDSHSFPPNSTTKIVSEELENVQVANITSFTEAFLESLSVHPDRLTFSKQAKHFHFFVPVALAPWAWNVLPFHALLCSSTPAPQVPCKDDLLPEGFPHRPTCRRSHGPLNSCKTSPGALTTLHSVLLRVTVLVEPRELSPHWCRPGFQALNFN